MKRVFLVGCPRSGTTLVQSLLAAHPRVASFPESHVLTRSVHTDHPLTRMGLVHPRNRLHLLRFLDAVDRPDLQHLVPRFPLHRNHIVNGLVHVLDQLAVDAGATVWVEKTPGHLHHVDLLMDQVPSARFVHVLRNGPDVVASLQDVTRRHPDAWGGERSLERCVERWLGDVELSLQREGAPRHLLTRYEDVTEHPRRELERILAFLDLPRDAVLEDRREGAGELLASGEEWKRGVLEEVSNRNGHRFHSALTAEERTWVLTQLRERGAPELVKMPPEPT